MRRSGGSGARCVGTGARAGAVRALGRRAARRHAARGAAVAARRRRGTARPRTSCGSPTSVPYASASSLVRPLPDRPVVAVVRRVRSASSTRATATTVSPSASRATRTPVASRPCSEISSTPMRTRLPAEENTRISSPGATVNAATTSPRASVTRMPRTPWPPRPWRLNDVERGALAVAARRHEQQHRARRGRRRSSRRASSAFLSFMPADAGGGAAHRPHVVLGEADRHAVAATP